MWTEKAARTAASAELATCVAADLTTVNDVACGTRAGEDQPSCSASKSRRTTGNDRRRRGETPCPASSSRDSNPADAGREYGSGVDGVDGVENDSSDVDRGD